jgi:Fe-S cluster assembly iron-binding protein IscA
MLVLTEQTQQVIRDAIEEGGAGPNGGLRISGTGHDGEAELEFELVAEPSVGDDVIDVAGARVFLDAVAADALSDKILDVHAHGDHFHFQLEEQEAA